MGKKGKTLKDATNGAETVLHGQSLKASSSKEAGVTPLRRNKPQKPVDGKFLLAVKRNDGLSLEMGCREFKNFWLADLERLLPFDVDQYKAGASIADYVGFLPDRGWAAEMLGLKQSSNATARAFHAGLVGVMASGGGDLEVALIALANFIHAHPDFAAAIERGAWHHPFGEKTLYYFNDSSSLTEEER